MDIDIGAWVTAKSDEIVDVLGKGHRESIYHQAFCVELMDTDDLKWESERVIPILYKGRQVGSVKSDIIINNKFVLELKAVSKKMGMQEKLQTLKYMEHAGIDNGMLINFWGSDPHGNTETMTLHTGDVLDVTTVDPKRRKVKVKC
jgi:GxxExxY protein